jgi:Ethanolamine utilization protein EutJ (predicted chaperonin)
VVQGEDNEVVRIIRSANPEVVAALGLQINIGEPDGGEIIGRKDGISVKKKGEVVFAIGGTHYAVVLVKQ